MKKVLSCLLVAAMAFSLCACGSPASSSSEAGAASDAASAEASDTASGDASGEAEGESSNRLQEILDAGKITMATSPDYPPYEFEDLSKTGQDAYVGADIELAKYIADKLGVELEIRAMSFDAMLAAVGEGTVDFALAGMTAKEDRKASMDFTTPYYVEGDQVVVVRADRASEFTTQESLQHASLAAQNGSHQYDVMVNVFPDADQNPVNQITDGILMVMEGKVDGLLLPAAPADTYISSYPDLVIADATITGFNGQEICAAVVKDQPELLEAISEVTTEVNEEGLFYTWLDEANALSQSMQQQ